MVGSAALMETINGGASDRKGSDPEPRRKPLPATDDALGEPSGEEVAQEPLAREDAADQDAARDEEYARLRAELTRAVLKVCPDWLAEHSEDLVQAGLVRVMEVERKRSGESRFSRTYLWMVAHSAVVDEIRRRQRRREVAFDSDESSETVVSPVPGPERRLRAREGAAAVRDCLGRLIESRRTAVLLYLYGHSLAEVAERMRWDLKRAKNLVYRGLADLRSCLATRGFRRDRR